MNSLFYATLLISILALSQIASAQNKCYQCNSNSDPGCEDPFDASKQQAKACPDGENWCRKIVQTVQGKTSVVRQCAKELYKNTTNSCYKTAGKASQSICTCQNEAGACNSAPVTLRGQSVVMAASSIFVALLLFK